MLTSWRAQLRALVIYVYQPTALAREALAREALSCQETIDILPTRVMKYRKVTNFGSAV